MPKNKRIIIVEDQPVVALDLLCFFKNNGYTNVSSFFSGKDAMKYINFEKPDLALLDIRLQDGISGIDIAEELEKLDVPFIFISAFSDSGNYQKALNLNPAHIFYKPVDYNALLNTVESVLNTIKAN